MSDIRHGIWAFFTNKDGEIEFNRVCMKCDAECKQSFRSVLMYCPKIDGKKGVRRSAGRK